MLKCDQLKITTVFENTSNSPVLLAQSGLSILVEAGEHKFLIDTGASSFVSHNINALGVNINLVEAIILSHGHFDHTGGIRAILARIKKKPVRVIAHPDALGLKYYKCQKTGKYTYVGIPFKTEELEHYGARLELTSEPVWLTEDIAVSGEEPMTTTFESIADCFYEKKADDFIADSCADDQSVYIRTNLGLVIILGCAHRGMINIIRHAQKLMKTEKVYMVLGGTHLEPASEEQVLLTIDALKDLDLQWLGVSHCTGLNVAAKLSQEFGKNFFYNNTGKIISFPFDQ